MQEWYSQWPVGLILALSLVAVMAIIPQLVQVMPSLIGCVFRVHECENLTHSVSQSRSRNQVAWALLPLVVMMTARYRVYPPLEGANEYVSILLALAVWAAYALLRLILSKVLRPTKMPSHAWSCVKSIPITFFVLVTLLWISTVGVMVFTGAERELIAQVLRWEMAVSYLLCLIRQLQIFTQYRGFLMGFSYLCALEFFPTGILIVSAIFL